MSIAGDPARGILAEVCPTFPKHWNDPCDWLEAGTVVYLVRIKSHSESPEWKRALIELTDDHDRRKYGWTSPNNLNLDENPALLPLERD